jgi:hypothetical protein
VQRQEVWGVEPSESIPALIARQYSGFGLCELESLQYDRGRNFLDGSVRFEPLYEIVVELRDQLR